ncbi:AMP-dependent synthetase/ligase [Streptomyces sp. ICBB 8177]|uniref:AMP-dependent synthetase/ligase n=1 Tax=Streptomyces sp. ICBB 8177 TaxID=563922 RepID=UPI000D67B121|nr:AMP-dependent synthetase/ligase [Streptomyces sp. ICBB 8177]PWI44959.1 long-chain fatty acid--CoA ligase [Streptomyces sp. ICBB 8177]
MRECATPPLVEAQQTGGLAETVHDMARREPNRAVLARRARDDSPWLRVTAEALRDEVRSVAKGLLASGVRFGDRIAVMARTRYEWTVLSYAVWTIGAQLVPLYPTSSAEQVQWALSHTSATAVVVEGEEHAMTVGAVCDRLPALRWIWQMDHDCLGELGRAGRGIPDELVDQNRWAVEPGSVAVIAYTSGTTGRPMGCRITHANLAYMSDTLLAGWGSLLAPAGQEPSILAFLPLAHIYGLTFQVAALRGGILLGHQADLTPAALTAAFASFRPTFVFAVPYVFQRMLDRARDQAEAEGNLRTFDKAIDVAARYAEAVERHAWGKGQGPGPALIATHARYNRTVYRRIREALGGRVRNAVTGGSPFDRYLGLVFAGAGITVYDGYGLTETTGAVTAQPPGRLKFGSVGRPLPGNRLRIAHDGEILVRGRTVCAGYLDDPAADAAGLHEGWLLTGDLGRFDDDGYLVITGRKKDVIITSGGKSLCPLVLEQRLTRHPLISQCVVVGDDRPYVTALITVDRSAVARWQRLVGRQVYDNWGPAPANQALHAEIQQAVSAANTAVSRAESIRAFRVLPTEFTVEDGLMTASLKLRRERIIQVYAAQIEDLYSK